MKYVTGFAASSQKLKKVMVAITALEVYLLFLLDCNVTLKCVTSWYCFKQIYNNEKEFKPLHTLLDNLYKDLHKQGIGTDRIQAEIISVKEKKQLWDSRAIGTDNPVALLNAVF